jgi:hypothetical protein
MGDSRTASKQRLTISNVRFLADLDFTSLNQKRNSIPNEFVELETLLRGFPHNVSNYGTPRTTLKENQVGLYLICW